jgi:5-methylcytosine-specific restriction endonuclease McrA
MLKSAMHPDKLQGKERSGKWPTVRAAYLKEHPTCTVCGGKKKVEVHHKLPFHTHPRLELDPGNFISLCEGDKAHNCHLAFGHSDNFKGYNPQVEQDSYLMASRIADNKRRLNAQAR